MAAELARLPSILPLCDDRKFEKHHTATQQSTVKRGSKTAIQTGGEWDYFGGYIARTWRGLYEEGAWIWFYYGIVSVSSFVAEFQYYVVGIECLLCCLKLSEYYERKF